MSGQRFWASGVMCFLTTIAFASEPAFQFTRAVESPSLDEEELLSVNLDSPIYEATQSGLEDLRLWDQTGQSVPFLVRQIKTTRTQTTRRTWTANNMSARPLDDGGLEIIVTLDSDDPAPDGLALVTPLNNFEKRVRVETSDEGRQWEEVAQSPFFDYSRYVDVRKDSISFPKTDRRHIRILIDNVTAAQESELLELTRRLQGTEETNRQERVVIQRRAFRVDKVQFWEDITREIPESAVKQAYPVGSFRVEQNRDEQQTYILVGMRQEPLTAFTIETPERNFSRLAIVEVEEVDGIRRNWRPISDVTLARIDFKDLEREQLSINFPESRHKQYRVVVENRDSPPLDITGITAQGNVYKVVFLATPEQSFHLVYGDADAKPAEHDTQTLRELLQAGYVPRSAELGEQQTRDSGGAEALNWPAILNNRMVLLAIIVVLVIVLGIALYRASRHLENSQDYPADSQ
jgi:hypothetical protein